MSTPTDPHTPTGMPGRERSSDPTVPALSEDGNSRMTRTYVTVVIVEVVALLGLWWLQASFS